MGDANEKDLSLDDEQSEEVAGGLARFETEKDVDFFRAEASEGEL